MKWLVSTKADWAWLYAGPVNTVRAEIGLPLQDRSPALDQWEQTVPVLLGYSRHLCPPPADFAEHVHVTGQWVRKGDVRPVPEPVCAFLEESTKPVIFVSFGSVLTVVYNNPAARVRLLRTITSAVIRAGALVLLSTEVRTAGHGHVRICACTCVRVLGDRDGGCCGEKGLQRRWQDRRSRSGMHSLMNARTPACRNTPARAHARQCQRSLFYSRMHARMRARMRTHACTHAHV